MFLLYYIMNQVSLSWNQEITILVRSVTVRQKTECVYKRFRYSCFPPVLHRSFKTYELTPILLRTLSFESFQKLSELSSRANMNEQKPALISIP